MTKPTPKTTPRPWAVLIGKAFNGAIVSPAGDAELGNWMVAQLVRWDADAALIVRAVNLHDDLLAALWITQQYIQQCAGPGRPPGDIAEHLKMARAALAKAEAP